MLQTTKTQDIHRCSVETPQTAVGRQTARLAGARYSDADHSLLPGTGPLRAAPLPSGWTGGPSAATGCHLPWSSSSAPLYPAARDRRHTVRPSRGSRAHVERSSAGLRPDLERAAATPINSARPLTAAPAGRPTARSSCGSCGYRSRGRGTDIAATGAGAGVRTSRLPGPGPGYGHRGYRSRGTEIAATGAITNSKEAGYYGYRDDLLS